MKRHLLVALLAGCASCAPNYFNTDTATLRRGWRPVGTIAHDPESFTEGLVFVGDRLFESVGREGKSALLEVAPKDGKLIQRIVWPKSLPGERTAPFAEGLAATPDALVQLSWKNGRALTWNSSTLERGADARYSGEGWGLAFDGELLWRSDGTERLHRHDLETFAPIGDPIVVHFGSQPSRNLNELEWVPPWLLANVWGSPLVIAIDPKSGVVDHVLDFSDLVDDVGASGKDSVLNGLAYHAPTKRLYVTGKLWAKLYVVELDP